MNTGRRVSGRPVTTNPNERNIVRNGNEGKVEDHPTPWRVEPREAGGHRLVVDALGEVVCIAYSAGTAERIVERMNAALSSGGNTAVPSC